MDTDSFIVCIKTEDIYVDIANGLPNSKFKVSNLSPSKDLEARKKCVY